MDEPQRASNAAQVAMSPNERRDLILATIQIQREAVRLWGRDTSVKEVLGILGYRVED